MKKQRKNYMKNKIFIGIILLAISLLNPQIIQAQGTVFFTNVDLSTTGSVAVGSNSWFAAGFITGSNIGGYLLNSIEVSLTNAAGNPLGLAAMIYNEVGVATTQPGSDLKTLQGIDSPLVGGIYS